MLFTAMTCRVAVAVVSQEFVKATWPMMELFIFAARLEMQKKMMESTAAGQPPKAEDEVDYDYYFIPDVYNSKTMGVSKEAGRLKDQWFDELMEMVMPLKEWPSAVRHEEADYRHEKIVVEAVKSRLEEMRSVGGRIARLIREKYLAFKEVQGLFGAPMAVEGQYINVQMIYQVKKDKEKKDDEEKDKKKTDKRISSYEDIYGTKRPLAIEKIFEPAKQLLRGNEKTTELNPDAPPKLVVLQGRAGIGKTTTAQYIAREWAKWRLWAEYSWVFLLRFRDLRGSDGDQKLMSEWVYDSLFAGVVAKDGFLMLWEDMIQPQVDYCSSLMGMMSRQDRMHSIRH